MRERQSTLTLEKRPPLSLDPRALLIIAHQKTGKSTILAQMPNCLIIDTQQGYDFYNASSIDMRNLEEYRLTCKSFVSEKFKAPYIVLDALTDFEPITASAAPALARKSVMYQKQVKSNSDLEGLMNLPSGRGWGFTRDSYFNGINFFTERAVKGIIFAAHLKDAAVEDGASIACLDLPGKIKTITERKVADSIAILSRDGRFGYFDFLPSNDKGCGSRAGHCQGRILISEYIGKTKYEERAVVKTYWDKIYKDIDPMYWEKEILPLFSNMVKVDGKMVKEEIVYDPEYLNAIKEKEEKENKEESKKGDK